jgi:C-3',4' desaturase CrtD
MAKVAVIGTGVGSLTAAALLARDGHEILMLEQNYLPGGCASSYYRQGVIFESGATTLVGLDVDMPLRYLLAETGINIDKIELLPSMEVHFSDGERLVRHKDLELWIKEAERVFGATGQAAFWRYCHKVAQFVWSASLRQKGFPPRRLSDLWSLLKNFRPQQLWYARLAFWSVESLLKKFNLDKNQKFVDFVNAQLLITAQNDYKETNILFGATALCYTNFSNYYVFGGMLQLVKPICEYIEAKGGKIEYRQMVQAVETMPKNSKTQYKIITNKGEFLADMLISGIPLNDTLPLFEPNQENKAENNKGNNAKWLSRLRKKLLPSAKLNSAFQLGIHFRRSILQENKPLHHQIHLAEPLPIIGGTTIFVSFSHPDDWTRAPLTEGVISVSTHIADPARFQELDKDTINKAILATLYKHQLLAEADIIYTHSSGAAGWARWTGRRWGFVGGYPQYIATRPWQMLDARLDGDAAYICGDTTYPGQGIVGVCLSGILAYEKMKSDHNLKAN